MRTPPRALLPTLALGAASLVASACSRPEPAPEDVDGLLHALWDGWDEASERDLAAMITNLDAAFSRQVEAGEDYPQKGEQSELVAAQLDGLTFSGDTPDPAPANGMFVATEMGCTGPEIDEVFAALNQDELHPNTYDFYERAYTSSDSDYFSGDADRLTWDVEIHASPVGFEYVEFLKGGSRRVTWDGGMVVLGRTHLIEPATESDDNRSFDQDYQLDVYYEREGAPMVHVWALWREIDLGTFGDQDSTALISVTLAEGQKWDEDTVELCEALR